MRRLELVLSYFLERIHSLQIGSFFMLYLLVFLNAVMVVFFFLVTKLYLFAIIIAIFFLVICLIAGFKMNKINKNADRIKKEIISRGYLK